ncbi:MAG: hypothetical protein ACW98X_23845 [Promethearchaeota archaeon]|jgi:hypothetical protein
MGSNYFLCIKQEESGVGKCDWMPGIIDASHGVVLVAPGEWIYKCASNEKKSPYALSPNEIKNYILYYWKK